MKMKTITVNVDEEVEEKFRKLASATYGRRKGFLGKALTEAMREWEKKKIETDNVARAMQLLEKGINMGGIKYKSRDELHER